MVRVPTTMTEADREGNHEPLLECDSEWRDRLSAPACCKAPEKGQKQTQKKEV